MPLSASPASYSSTEGAEVTRPDRALIPPGLLILATEFGKRRVVDHQQVLSVVLLRGDGEIEAAGL